MSYKITRLARQIMEIKEGKKQPTKKPQATKKTTAGFSVTCHCWLYS